MARIRALLSAALNLIGFYPDNLARFLGAGDSDQLGAQMSSCFPLSATRAIRACRMNKGLYRSDWTWFGHDIGHSDLSAKTPLACEEVSFFSGGQARALAFRAAFTSQ